MKTKIMFLLISLTLSGILHAESVDIPVLYRNPSEIKSGQLKEFGFYENETRIVLAFRIKDLQTVIKNPKASMGFYADTDNDLKTGRYPGSRGWDFQINVMLHRKTAEMIKWNGNDAEKFSIRDQYAVSLDGDVLYVTFLKSAVPGIVFSDQFKFRTAQFRDNQRVDKQKTYGVFFKKYELPADK